MDGMNHLLIFLVTCILGSGTARLGASWRGLSLGGESAAAKSTRNGQPESNLPPDRYQQLRLQTLAHAALIAGPRIKNPRIADGGLDREVVASLAEQRLWRRSHLGAMLASSSTHMLLHDQQPAVLANVHTNSASVPGPKSVSRQTAPQIACTVPTIRSVNGKSANPVFTPTEPDNHFHIEGCSFGSVAGSVRLQPNSHTLQFGTPVQPISLHPESVDGWKNDAIDVYIDPRLKSVPDFVADLIIHLPSGRELRLDGCTFVASRSESQLLKSIPAAWISLDAPATSAHAIQQVEFESPPFTSEQVPAGATGTSAFVARSDPAPFSTGRDTYDLSQLAPGWMVESVELNVFDASCPSENNQAENHGAWTTNWIARGFVIAWGSETCATHIPPLFNFTLNSSQYAVRVWVVGPAGTEPLRGGS
jgi:hypothetical protein